MHLYAGKLLHILHLGNGLESICLLMLVLQNQQVAAHHNLTKATLEGRKWSSWSRSGRYYTLFSVVLLSALKDKKLWKSQIFLFIFRSRMAALLDSSFHMQSNYLDIKETKVVHFFMPILI